MQIFLFFFFFLLSEVLSYLPQPLFVFANCLCCYSIPPMFCFMMCHVPFVCKEQEVALCVMGLSIEVSSRSPITVLGSEAA